ncbi:hypothetical protein CEXT_363171 [Caerostris extrusa]|uniref:Uncharacterized protein n=1 Tax=Caerostris extrusa TaxID=172846 RepID=A0AAV4QZ50_CAEEX|nr:hypothetical protein CEXT_363171 [Caerostris extrusa]
MRIIYADKNKLYGHKQPTIKPTIDLPRRPTDLFAKKRQKSGTKHQQRSKHVEEKGNQNEPTAYVRASNVMDVVCATNAIDTNSPQLNQRSSSTKAQRFVCKNIGKNWGLNTNNKASMWKRRGHQNEATAYVRASKVMDVVCGTSSMVTNSPQLNQRRHTDLFAKREAKNRGLNTNKAERATAYVRASKVMDVVCAAPTQSSVYDARAPFESTRPPLSSWGEGEGGERQVRMEPWNMLFHSSFFCF